MDLGALVFYVVAAVTVVAALGVVTTRNVVYSALLLILALVQILVYGGTVSILLLFALMLTRPQERPIMNHRGWPVAAAGALVLLAVLVYQAVATPWRPASATTSAAATAATAPVRVAPADLGMALFTTWSVPFEIASLVLLVALLGALLIARSSSEPDRDAVAAAARLHS